MFGVVWLRSLLYVPCSLCMSADDSWGRMFTNAVCDNLASLVKELVIVLSLAQGSVCV